jgi:hypothetical protein
MNSQMNRKSDRNLVVFIQRRVTTSEPDDLVVVFKSLAADVDPSRRLTVKPEGLKKGAVCSWE